MSKILVEHGERKQLAKLYNVTVRCIYNALENKTDSALAKNIRKAAIERGGALVEDKPKQKIS